jgi:hypothetical protein
LRATPFSEANTDTLTVAVVAHPFVVTVYEMFVFPMDTPVTTPDDEPTVAIELFADAHVPPLVELASVVLAPVAMLVVPVMPPTVG